MRIIGIDPGERWVGFAALDIGPAGVRVDTRVYDARVVRDSTTVGTSRGISWYVIADMLASIVAPAGAGDTCVVIEDYRVRPVGHQAFDSADVPRLIGALTTKVLSASMLCDVAFVAPTDKVHIADELLGKAFAKYRSQWPTRSRVQWRHARSAWRVVGQHMLERKPGALSFVRTLTESREMSAWLPTNSASVRDLLDLYVPAHKWL